MSPGSALLDASAFWRLSSRDLEPNRAAELADRVERGLICTSTPLLLEVRAGRNDPVADPVALPLLWLSDRAETRAVELQRQLREQHLHLGVPPLDYLIAATAEDHGAAVLHYDAHFDRIAERTDLAVGVELLAPLGSLD